MDKQAQAGSYGLLFLRYASKAAKLSAKLSHTAKLRHPLSVGKC